MLGALRMQTGTAIREKLLLRMYTSDKTSFLVLKLTRWREKFRCKNKSFYFSFYFSCTFDFENSFFVICLFFQLIELGLAWSLLFFVSYKSQIKKL